VFNRIFSSKATPAQIKQHNAALLLREIYAREAISRVQLARLTGLSRPSVTELMQGLIEKGLVCELGPEDISDKVGKKAQLLALNPDAFQLVCIAVSNATVTGSLFNLRMQAATQEALPLHDAQNHEVVRLIKQVGESIIAKATCPVLGVAVGIPGIIDTQRGVVHLAASLGWQNLPLSQILTDHFQLPVYIGNDSNLAAMGEYRFGRAQGAKDLVMVEVGDGIGIGIISDGRIIEGSTHAAGELGHTPFASLEDECICGRYGCLETKVSWWAIKRQAQRIAQEYADAPLHRLANGAPVTPAMLRQALFEGDTHALQLVDEAATYLGMALIMVIHLLNPKHIVLTGSMLELGEPFIQRVQDTIEERALPYVSNHIEIVANPSDEHSILLGAGAFLLQRELGL
jgi:predicted NBD/HSP70 family sugar kinase